MEGLGALTVFVTILFLIVAVLAFLMPFFVLRIRNEMISMNQKMSELVKILGDEKANYSSVEVTSSGERVKKCPSCRTNNRLEDGTCTACGKPIP